MLGAQGIFFQTYYNLNIKDKIFKFALKISSKGVGF